MSQNHDLSSRIGNAIGRLVVAETSLHLQNLLVLQVCNIF